ncbi:DUF6461 domain-containing protein [Streptomyces solaniscabiei]|uniref:DUF6461 domain-containing protein n=1 Tax=Streptomyces solaniscabiei TaxID=2683255 RepID=UPI0027E1BF08|nr:DUF6461 domain-containing protein [Streptomyces solaniscabiei]
MRPGTPDHLRVAHSQGRHSRCPELHCELGFALSDGGGETSGRVDTKVASFALAERLTGVRVTEKLLRHARYQVGLATEGPAEE